MVKHEGIRHRRAKDRIAFILNNAGINYTNVITDDDLKDSNGNSKAKFSNQMISEWMTKDYWPDVYFERQYMGIWSATLQPVIIELNGKSHNSKMGTVKDDRRDKHFLDKGIPTIRFKVDDIVGRNPYSVNDILQMIDLEMRHQLKQK